MIVAFILGLLTGSGIGVLIMAVLHMSKDDSNISIHHICDDCIYKNARVYDSPCKDCVGDHYKSV